MKRFSILTGVVFAVLTVIVGPAWSETKLSDKVTLSGAVEVEIGVLNEEAADSSDIALATAEIVIGAAINENVSAEVVLLFEEDDTEFTVDTGTVTIEAAEGLSVTAGVMTLPFGMFNSHFISDPQTLELGETAQSALMVSYGIDMVDISLGLFNGDVDKVGKDNKIDDLFAAVNINPAEGISLGASYISDIADTDADITGEADIDAGGTGFVTDIVAGYSAYFSGSFGPVSVEAEYLAAANDDLDLDGDGNGDQPVTFNVELAYAVSDALEVAARYEGNEEYFDLPETQYGLALAYGLHENTTISLEYLTGEYDNLASDEVSSVTAQLTVEF